MTTSPTTAAAAANPLLSVFPDAPDLSASIASKQQLRAKRWKHFRESYPWLSWLALALVGVGVVLAFFSAIAGGGVVALVLIVGIAIYAYQASKAEDEFFMAYAQARGLVVGAENAGVSSSLPLLRRGDKRTFDRTMRGRIGGGTAYLNEYTYTEVSTDSEGNRTETDYPFTMVLMTLPDAVAQRFAGVYCRKKGISFGRLQDKLAHDRDVKTESAEFHNKYSLRVVDEQDDIALFELFNTTFLHDVSSGRQVSGDLVQWEQADNQLMVFVKGHKETVAELDQLASLAAWIEHRYLEEYQ